MRHVVVVGVLLAIGTGCGGAADSANPGGMHDHGGTGGLPDTELGGSAGATAGGNALGGDGGRNGGDAGRGGDAGYDDVGAAGYPDGAAGIPDFGNCVADLSGTHGDAISVHGHAGVLGDVDYTIWGFSTGSGSLQGIELTTSSNLGQKGSPDGIRDTHLTAYTPTHNVVEGEIYHRDPEQLEFGINTQAPTTGVSVVSCTDAAATGSFAFIRFSNPDTNGVYELDCPGSDIQVHGCFRYVN